MDDPNPTWENRLISAGTWHNVQLASIGTGRYKKYEGMRVDDAAKAAGQDPYDFVFALLIAAARQRRAACGTSSTKPI